MDTFDLDKVFRDIGGFGKYQLRRFILICILLVFATYPLLSYIFTTRNIKYRCHVDECESKETTFHAPWLKNAIPFKEDEPSRCLRYPSTRAGGEDCNTTLFNKSESVRCQHFVYENMNETTIAKDFNVLCDDNLWKLTIVGSINNVGYMFGLPLSAYLSDKFGRRMMMITPVLLSTTFGLLKSFSPTYIIFIVLEFLEATLGSGAYSATYILGMEMLSAEYRVLGSTVLSCIFTLGETIMGLVAWYVPSWRLMVRILYAPGLLLVVYYWITDESVRWLMSNNKHEEAKVILKKIANENKRKLEPAALKQLNASTVELYTKKATDSFVDVFHSPVLFLRLVNCSLGWLCCTFVYYGLTMHSVGISGNMYINFIAGALIEIPGYIVVNFTLSRIGRKPSLSYSFLLSGLACFGFVFTPESNTSSRLFLFLLGKFAATITYTSIYLFTTELFPTCLRHSFISTCNTFGRMGVMLAPQVPLLANIFKPLPMIMFGSMATTAGIFSFFLPETLFIELPDTIEEAVNIGKPKPKHIEKEWSVNLKSFSSVNL